MNERTFDLRCAIISEGNKATAIENGIKEKLNELIRIACDGGKVIDISKYDAMYYWGIETLQAKRVYLDDEGKHGMVDLEGYDGKTHKWRTDCVSVSCIMSIAFAVDEEVNKEYFKDVYKGGSL